MSEERNFKSLFREKADHLFFSNPVLVAGLVIGQVAAGAKSLQCAVALSITFLYITVPVLVFASVIGKRLPQVLRVVSYVLISGLMLYPSIAVCKAISPNLVDSVGIYLPLLAVTTVPVAYSAKFSERHDLVTAALDSFFLSVGFAIAAVVIGSIREIIGAGTIWGIKVSSISFPSALLPFAGFILMGFLGAGIAGIRILMGKPEYKGFSVREEESTNE